MNIIILGPQGSGKGTQAKLLTEKLNLYDLDMGKFLREVAKINPKIDSIVNKKGKLIPAGIVFSLMSEQLEKEVPDRSNILFDGYPRSIKQYELLKTWLKEKRGKISHAIYLSIGEEESVRRLSKRRICEKCGTIYNLITNPPPGGKCECGGNLFQREDDKPEAIKQRLTVYKKTTEPLIDIYKKEGILLEINGERPTDVIFKDIISRLGQGDEEGRNKN
ncbi:MAG: adenylate kinase family protein [Patescibacteria group bacterium]